MLIICLFSSFFLRVLVSFELHARFLLKSNSFLEFHSGFINDTEINFSSGDINSSFEIFLTNPSPSTNSNPSANSAVIANLTTFDVFEFDFTFNESTINDVLCYKKAIIYENYQENCRFLTNSSRNIYLNSTNFAKKSLFAGQTDLQTLPTSKTTFFIDNTQFPSTDSAIIANKDDLFVETVLKIDVTASNAYFVRAVGVGAALVVVLVVVVCILFYLMFKYNDVKKKSREEILNLNPNDRSFVAGGGSIPNTNKKRVGSMNRNESFEESKVEISSLNNSMTRRFV